MRLRGKPMKQWMQIAALCLFFMGFSVLSTQAQIGGPPSITVPPLGISVSAGGTALLTATAVDATKGVKWLYNGGTLPAGSKVSTLNVLGIGAVSTLTINPAT